VQSLSEDGPWELEVVGFQLYTASFTFLVDLVFYGDEGASADIRLQGSFQLHRPDGTIESLDVQTDSWERLGAVFVLRLDTITVARITKTSDLRVEFTSGHVITSSSEGTENWEMNAPGGVKFIAGPDGHEPYIWDGDPKHKFTCRADGRWFNGDGEEVAEPQLRKGWGSSKS
jgi:uncharacterized protein DUF6188